jgi:pimeloyl-ACP methyl ester carboxylesterase
MRKLLFALFISFFIVCVGYLIWSKTFKSQIVHRKIITYDYSFLFQNIASSHIPDITIPKHLKNQYQFLTLPINWNDRNSEKYKMTIYHANKNYKHCSNLMLFVLGGPGDHISYMKFLADKMFQCLGKNWDVVIFDQRGCGLSLFKLNGKLIDFKCLTMAQAASDIHALIKLERKKGIKHIVLGGGSSGAILALKYAITHSNLIDMLYIDGGAASADFVNLSNKLAFQKISQRLKPTSIVNIAKHYGIDKDLLFEYLWWQLARDPMLQKPLWNNLKAKNSAGGKALKQYMENSIIVPPFSKAKLLNNLASLWRLYYIGSLELIPKPAEQIKSEYSIFKPYNTILNWLVKKYHLKWLPFDYRNQLYKISVKTLITDGLNDPMVPFHASENIYKNMDSNKAMLLGFKNTGHGAIITHMATIMHIIKLYLNNSKTSIKERIIKNYAKENILVF